MSEAYRMAKSANSSVSLIAIAHMLYLDLNNLVPISLVDVGEVSVKIALVSIKMGFLSAQLPTKTSALCMSRVRGLVSELIDLEKKM